MPKSLVDKSIMLDWVRRNKGKIISKKKYFTLFGYSQSTNVQDTFLYMQNYLEKLKGNMVRIK